MFSSILADPVTVTLALPPVNWRSLMAGGRPVCPPAVDEIPARTRTLATTLERNGMRRMGFTSVVV
jgi:hypothetical protein